MHDPYLLKSHIHNNVKTKQINKQLINSILPLQDVYVTIIHILLLDDLQHNYIHII